MIKPPAIGLANFYQAILGFRVGTKPGHCLQLERIRLIDRIARLVRHIVKRQAALAPEREVLRNPRQRMRGQKTHGLVVNRQAAGLELLVIHTPGGHQNGSNILGVAF